MSISRKPLSGGSSPPLRPVRLSICLWLSPELALWIRRHAIGSTPSAWLRGQLQGLMEREQAEVRRLRRQRSDGPG
jgi:hypothetical protein